MNNKHLHVFIYICILYSTLYFHVEIQCMIYMYMYLYSTCMCDKKRRFMNMYTRIYIFIHCSTLQFYVQISYIPTCIFPFTSCKVYKNVHLQSIHFSAEYRLFLRSIHIKYIHVCSSSFSSQENCQQQSFLISPALTSPSLTVGPA